jgi:Lysyl-tRNA synthetase (class I)
MLFLREEDKVKEVVARTSMKKIEDMKDWSPIMPICEKCGKIATTSVTWHSEDEYRYTCNKDVEYTKGCNYTAMQSLRIIITSSSGDCTGQYGRPYLIQA